MFDKFKVHTLTIVALLIRITAAYANVKHYKLKYVYQMINHMYHWNLHQFIDCVLQGCLSSVFDCYYDITSESTPLLALVSHSQLGGLLYFLSYLVNSGNIPPWGLLHPSLEIFFSPWNIKLESTFTLRCAASRHRLVDKWEGRYPLLGVCFCSPLSERLILVSATKRSALPKTSQLHLLLFHLGSQTEFHQLLNTLWNCGKFFL